MRAIHALVTFALVAAACERGGEPAPLPARPTIVELGWHSGECGVPLCGVEISVEGVRIDVVFASIRGNVIGTAEGTLSRTGAAELSGLANELTDRAFAPLYGCRGCTDAAVGFVRYASGGTTRRIEWDRPGQAPLPLRELFSFAMKIARPLRLCRTSELVRPAAECEPVGHT